MAYTSCAVEVAANIVADCASPLVAGFTGRGVYIPRSYAPTISRNASNPRKIEDVAIGPSQQTVALENLIQNPYTGTNVAANAENGTYTKSIALRVPAHGADASRDIVEPLMKSPLGGIVILERQDTSGVGSFPIFGIEKGAKATEETQNDYENNGDWAATLTTEERVAEYEFFDTDYATTLGKFEALLAAAH